MFNVDGRISLTEENIGEYVIADSDRELSLGSNYGGGVGINNVSGFVVSNEVVRIELVYFEDFYASYNITNFDIRTELPCYPIRNEIITVSTLPSNGYIGTRIIYQNDLYTYNGTEWIAIKEVDVPTKVSELENDSNFITNDKIPEIAEQAASLIDTSLLSALGSGVIE